ncbi:hypothetical protein GDO78_013607 [Eleutherodactylus coqui]|uniref:Histone chaperone domain-containing protein n=1 Tax=Eleutherodactylus coqui TaxID=57060 RepID=A0A8J6JR30_ELECQ|nr:hypothetical protein GDO78_013607 [Eleutherodactylus coqui]
MAGDEGREMRIFTRGLFERSPDLSVLSQSVVRSKFLAHTGRSALSPQERQILKKIVEEELLRMQEEEASDDEPLIRKVQKRARRDSDEDKVPPGKRQKPTDDNESEEDSGIEQRDIKRVSGSSPEAPVSKKVPETAAVKVDGHKRRIKTTPKRGKETINERSEEADDGKVTAWKQKKGSDSSSEIKESSRPQDDDSDSEVEMVKPKQKEATKKESACAGEDRSKKAKAVKKPLENETDSDGEERGHKKKGGKERTAPRTEGKPQVKVKRAQGKGHKEEESAGKRASKKTTKKDSDSEESAASSKDSDGEEEEHSGKTKTPREDSDSEEESAASKKDSESDEEESAKKRAPKNNNDTAGEKRPPTKKMDDESDQSTDSDEEKSKPVANKSKETGGKGGMKKTAPKESDSDKERTKKKAEGKDGGDSDSSEKSELETKGNSNKKQSASKEEHPSIVRLKKYILTCGARKNYKKLFQDCRSVKSMVEVLKKELEDLGVKGKPSLEKCRVVRLKREEAAELAELDTSNIIATAGRPRRRTTWNPYQTSPKHESSPYHKTVGTDSEGEEGPPRKKRPMDWSSLRGIISDGDSD